MGRVLVTGRPASGKTTLALRVLDALRERGEHVAGFTTKEIKRGGRRTGFTVTGVGGLERTLAIEGGNGPRVGRYTVDVAAFEEVALLELESGLELGATLIVDEIGKMELASSRFCDLLPKVFDSERLLATVHAHRHPVTDELKQRVDVKLVEVGPLNRDRLVPLVVDWMSA
jgi:nucleoside-triphosphatase